MSKNVNLIIDDLVGTLTDPIIVSSSTQLAGEIPFPNG